MFRRKRLSRFAAVLGAALVVSVTAVAETRTVEPKGVYAQIDTRLAQEAIQALAKGSPAEQQQVQERIKGHPENYAPPVLYALSQTLFQAGQKDDAAFWFYAGQLRARFDANRCADATARQAVGVLNQAYGPLINQYTFQDIAKLESLVPRVIDWDRQTPHHYDHRWINLHGMSAMRAALDAKDDTHPPPQLSLPQAQWSAIAEKTRADYLAGFRQAIASLKARR